MKCNVNMKTKKKLFTAIFSLLLFGCDVKYGQKAERTKSTFATWCCHRIFNISWITRLPIKQYQTD